MCLGEDSEGVVSLTDLHSMTQHGVACCRMIVFGLNQCSQCSGHARCANAVFVMPHTIHDVTKSGMQEVGMASQRAVYHISPASVSHVYVNVVCQL